MQIITYLNDLFFLLRSIDSFNFTNDATLCVSDQAIETVLETMKRNSEIVIFWLENYYMKLNNNTSHLLNSGSNYEQIWAEICEDKVRESSYVNFWGVNN